MNQLFLVSHFSHKRLANDGLVMEDEMTLGSSVTSMAFDDALETVSSLIP